MPPKGQTNNAALAWLKRARGNYARARQPKPVEGFWEDLCFDAQQAAEKAIKAVMIDQQVQFSYTHDIGKLLEQLAGQGVVVPREVNEAAALTEYAVQTRYPGWGDPVTEADWIEAIKAAGAVLVWASTQVKAL